MPKARSARAAQALVCGCAVGVRSSARSRRVLALQKQLRELKEGRREMEEEANKFTREIHDLTERSGRVRAKFAEPNSPSLMLPSLGADVGGVSAVPVQMWEGGIGDSAIADECVVAGAG